ncbi:MAG: UDP-N-acetylmuramoyl-tripeptide--D-alanyl-D-alanine ligase [Blautia sp.]|nr:UDP-N-acetylmuramoyl-tripeptide--D-alanyl-D-alanine ligase [Blautia sp.]
MKNLTLRNIALACNGKFIGDPGLLEKEITSVITDSRKAEAGTLFVPIVGERVDGHTFIPQVMEAGALATLSERELPGAAYPYIRVGSSLQALKDLAAFYLEQLDIPVVGITGSVGKTSTKEAIASVLSQKYRTLKTQGNFNNEIGVPLTVFRLREEDEIAVLEMGINHFGEMTRLARIARPDTAVITNIGTAHLEFLGDRDGILRAKTEMLPYVQDNGHIILNGDDDKLVTVKGIKGIEPVFFGLESNGKNTVWADEIRSMGLMGTHCRIHILEASAAVRNEGLEEEADLGRMDGVSLSESEAQEEELRDLTALDGYGRNTDIGIQDGAVLTEEEEQAEELEELAELDGASADETAAPDSCDEIVTVQSAPRIYCEVCGTKAQEPRPGALPMRRKEPAPGLVTVKELVTEQLQEISFEVTVPVPGRHMVYNALAATAVGRVYGLSTEQIRAGIEAIETIGGRMNRIRTDRFLIVDDCYNANPGSMKASIDVMKDAGTRRVLILGDMGELGAGEEEMHREVGAFAAASGAQVMLFVGTLAAQMAQGAGEHVSEGQAIAHFDTTDALINGLQEYVREGDTILVKASRFMKLEQVVAALKEM